MTLWKKLIKEKEWRTEKWAFAALLAGFILTGAAHYFSQKNIINSAASNGLLNNQYRIVSKLKDADHHLLAMENNTQYFILTEDRKFLRRLDRQMLQAQRRIDEIEELLPDDTPEQGRRFSVLREKFLEKIDFSNEVLDVFREGGKESAEEFIQRQQESDMEDNWRNAVEAFTQANGTSLNIEEQETHTHHAHLLFVDNIGFLIGIGLLVFAFIYLLYGLRKQMNLQEYLLEAKAEVEKSVKIKEQFLANMSHEIRTPLQAILGYTHLLSKEKLTEKQSQFVQYVQTASENLLHIVTDILDISKIESGMVRLENVSFSLSSLLHSVDSLFLPKTREKGLYLKLHPNPVIPDLLIGDPARLTQILVNLIGNALKFTQTGGIDIFQEAVEQSPTRLVLKISIKDTGVGIAPEKLPLIFKRFEQGDAKVTRMYGGSGLGLFIVKELVELQQGHIQVKSEPGKGSVFSFVIPYAIATAKTPRLKNDSGQVDLTENFGTTSILLVEDNLLNQRVVGTFLSERGIDYDIADNGKTAIQQLEKKNYDLILMDVQMPEMDGYSATEYIRENMGLRIPIIAMTAHAFAGEREKALSNGMNDYISKPIKEEDLFRLIARFVPLIRNSLPLSDTGETDISGQPPADRNRLSIDYNFLMESSKGKKEYLRDILELFLQQAPLEIARIDQAMIEGKRESVGKLAHHMKSTVGYVGLDNSFRPLLENIERQVKNNGSPDDLKLLVAHLKQLTKDAIEKVKTEAMPLVEKKEN